VGAQVWQDLEEPIHSHPRLEIPDGQEQRDADGEIQSLSDGRPVSGGRESVKVNATGDHPHSLLGHSMKAGEPVSHESAQGKDSLAPPEDPPFDRSPG
jgi:hypothetical protein